MLRLSLHFKKISQLPPNDNKQFKIAVTILLGYNGVFKSTNKKYNFYFAVSVNDDGFSVNTTPERALEVKFTIKENYRIFVKKCFLFKEENRPFQI